jgi:hypothetical protein
LYNYNVYFTFNSLNYLKSHLGGSTFELVGPFAAEALSVGCRGQAVPTSTTINDPKHWYDRAAEMRALSETMNDIETRAIMLRSPLTTTSWPIAPCIVPEVRGNRTRNGEMMPQESDLATAIEQVAGAKANVAKQRERIARLRHAGYSTLDAERALGVFIRTLRVFEDHERQIHDELRR